MCDFGNGGGVVSEWIKVSDRKQAQGYRVLFYDGLDVFTMAFSDFELYWLGRNGSNISVTHWMTLPRPPKNKAP